MPEGFDAKGIGFAVKDIVIGVAAAAVGGTGGPAAASGVMKAGDGIDKIIAMATGGESRGQKFDRAGFEGRPLPPPVAPAPSPASPQVPTDRDQAMAHLGGVGWTPEQITKILAGPKQNSMAQIAPPQVEGERVALAAATPVERVPGTPVAPVPGEALQAKAGKAVPAVTGRRVEKNETA